MIDFAKERPISLREAAEVASALRGKDRPIHYRTLWRWAAKGLRGIFLDSTFVGGERVTSREAVARFTERMSAVRQDAVEPKHERRSARRRREKDYAAARRHLAAEHGI